MGSRSRDEADHLDSLQMLCPHCNRIKLLKPVFRKFQRFCTLERYSMLDQYTEQRLDNVKNALTAGSDILKCWGGELVESEQFRDKNSGTDKLAHRYVSITLQDRPIARPCPNPLLVDSTVLSFSD